MELGEKGKGSKKKENSDTDNSLVITGGEGGGQR